MSNATVSRPTRRDPTTGPRDTHWFARHGLLRDLQHPSQVVENITPNWYASIMGTGIVAVAAAKLPVQPRGLHTAGLVVWALASILLVALTAATVAHWVRHRATARSHALHPVMGHFYGAPPMALMTVGAGTLLLGRDVLGLPLAVGVDAVLWTVGTLTGLAAAAVVPYLMFTRGEVKTDSAFGGWLMPVVPPMVSASTGALLVPNVAAGQLRLTMVLACYAMFGLSLMASVVVITLIWWKLAVHRVGDAKMVPTLWIVLGPLGQSITAAGQLGGVSTQVLPAPYGSAFHAFGLIYGLPVLGFTLLWAGIAAAITIRTAREGLPFSLTWWSFTFPVGTVVTGISGLAVATGSEVLLWAAVLFFAGLAVAWATVAARTCHGSVVQGHLLLTPQPAASR